MATSQPAERTFQCGPGVPSINAAAITNSRIVTVGNDTRVRVWNISGRLEHTLEGHAEALYAVIVSPDGARIVSAGDQNDIKVWSLATGELEKTRHFEGNHHWSALAATPDSAGFVSIDQHGEAWLLGFNGDWQCIRNGDVSSGMREHNVVAVTPDGARLISGGRSIHVEVRNLATGQLERRIESSRGARALAVTPDGARIISGDEDCVRIWNLATGELERTTKGGTRAVAVTPDGARLMVGRGDVEIWNLATGELERTLEAHGVWALTVTPDGARVVSVNTKEGMVSIWRL